MAHLEAGIEYLWADAGAVLDPSPRLRPEEHEAGVSFTLGVVAPDEVPVPAAYGRRLDQPRKLLEQGRSSQSFFRRVCYVAIENMPLAVFGTSIAAKSFFG